MLVQKGSATREKILGKIRAALRDHAASMPFPEAEHFDPKDGFVHSELSNDELFAESFLSLGGKYIYCANDEEALQQIAALHTTFGWQKLFCADSHYLDRARQAQLHFVLPPDNADDTADACITRCEALIARTGSFLISSRQEFGRVSPVFYPVHIVVAYQSDLVYDIADAYEKVKKKYKDQSPSMISLQTGPSRTADIEKTLVTGVHGPKEVFCIYIDQ